MIIVGSSLPREYLSYLQAAGHAVVILPPDPHLPDPVASHPDMLLFLMEDTLITDRTYHEDTAGEELNKICSVGNLKMQLTDEPPGISYPEDIRFNALLLGQYLFCHATHTSPAILAMASKAQIIPVPTHQGYARCTACPVGENALITSDPSIAVKANENGLDVCLIRQGHILLPGYPYGFIGGCCGATKDHIFFCGDPTLHPDGEQMLSFIRSRGITPHWIPDLPLFDSGSLFFISEHNQQKNSL